MSPIPYQCPYCASHLRIPPNIVSRKLLCPHCQAEIEVAPRSGETAISRSPRTAKPGTQPPPPAQVPAPTSSARQGLILALIGGGAGLLILLIAIIVAVSSGDQQKPLIRAAPIAAADPIKAAGKPPAMVELPAERPPALISREKPAATTKPKTDAALEDGWPDASKLVFNDGAVEVRLAWVSAGPVEVKDFRGSFFSSKSYLSISVRMRNLSETKRILYKSSQQAFGRVEARLRANFDNPYLMVDFGVGIKVVRHVPSAAIEPGQTLEDMLVFEHPIERMEYLRLDLPGDSLGVKQRLRFHIPRSMISFR